MPNSTRSTPPRPSSAAQTISRNSGPNGAAPNSTRAASTRSSPNSPNTPRAARRPPARSATSPTTAGPHALPRIPRHGTLRLNRHRRGRLQARHRKPAEMRRYALDTRRAPTQSSLSAALSKATASMTSGSAAHPETREISHKLTYTPGCTDVFRSPHAIGLLRQRMSRGLTGDSNGSVSDAVVLRGTVETRESACPATILPGSALNESASGCENAPPLQPVGSNSE